MITKNNILTDFSNLTKKQLMEITTNLWIPEQTNLNDLQLISLNGNLNKITNDISFSIIKCSNKNYDENINSAYVFNKNNKNNETNKNNEINKTNETNKNNAKLNKVVLDISKKPCNYIITEIYKNKLHGRLCNDICKENTDKCIKHLNKTNELPNDIIMTQNTCKHIITQQSRGKNRKGMICGNFTFNSKDPLYCKQHESRKHPFLDDQLNEIQTTMRTFKVRFYRNKKQHDKLIKYFGDARYTYNNCVDDQSDGKFDDLRNKYVTNTNHYFLKETPKEIRAFAVKEYITNKNNIKNQYHKKLQQELWKRENIPLLYNKSYKHKTIKIPVMKHKLKKNEQSITIPKDSVKIKHNKIYIYSRKFSNEPLNLNKRSKKDKKLQKQLKEILYHDIKIIKTLTDKFYICFSENIKLNEKNKQEKNIALDPGIRTFITGYNENEILEIGKDINKIMEYHINKKMILHKNYVFEKEKSIKKILKKKYRQKCEKIKNIMLNFHCNAISKLTEEYTTIFLPKLNPHNMSKNINKMNKKICYTLQHGNFIKRLKDKAIIKSINIPKTTERMTTKTCGRCFEISDPKSNKIFTCEKCNISIDRDYNAARNIYIQQIIKN